MNETANSTPSSDAGRPKCCRGRGKRALFGAFAIVVVAVLTVGAFQAFGHGPFRRGLCGSMDPAQVDKKIDRIAGWIVEDLGGTPEQQAKLSAIAKAAAKDLAPVHDELVAGRRQAVEILTAREIDRAALEAHRARQMQLLTTVSERLTAAVADAAEVLTSEQRVKAADRLASHMARFGH
jgi:Spy/CpxP family protein refolding chaperone